MWIVIVEGIFIEKTRKSFEKFYILLFVFTYFWQSVWYKSIQQNAYFRIISSFFNSPSNFFSSERKYPGSPPNLKLDTLYVSHYGFVDKGTKNNGSLKIKLLCFLWLCQKCRLFHGGEKYTNGVVVTH